MDAAAPASAAVLALALGAVLNNQPKFLISNVKKRIPLNSGQREVNIKRRLNRNMVLALVSCHSLRRR